MLAYLTFYLTFFFCFSCTVVTENKTPFSYFLAVMLLGNGWHSTNQKFIWDSNSGLKREGWRVLCGSHGLGLVPGPQGWLLVAVSRLKLRQGFSRERSFHVGILNPEASWCWLRMHGFVWWELVLWNGVLLAQVGTSTDLAACQPVPANRSFLFGRPEQVCNGHAVTWVWGSEWLWLFLQLFYPLEPNDFSPHCCPVDQRIRLLTKCLSN